MGRQEKLHQMAQSIDQCRVVTDFCGAENSLCLAPASHARLVRLWPISTCQRTPFTTAFLGKADIALLAQTRKCTNLLKSGALRGTCSASCPCASQRWL